MKRPSVGILTYHYAYNYGAVIQCYGLQEVLNSLGFRAEVLNYVPAGIKPRPVWTGWEIRSKRPLRHAKRRWLEVRYGAACRKAFQLFRNNHLHLTTLLQTGKELAHEVQRFDALIAGSDQIWNRSYSTDPAYFLHFDAPFRNMRLSYAASFGYKDQPRAGLDDVGRWLNDMEFLSVRDKVSQKIVRELSGRSAALVADPSILADYTSLMKDVCLPSSDYIFVYCLGAEIADGDAAAIAAIRNLVGDIPVVAVVASAHKPRVVTCADHVIYDAGPIEWLSLIANARFVYTDSFHATIVAIECQKPCVAYYAEKMRAPRLLDFAMRYGFGDNVIASSGSIEGCALDSTCVLRELQKDKARSLALLEQALERGLSR